MKKIVISLTIAAFATASALAEDCHGAKGAKGAKTASTKECSGQASTACASKANQAKSSLKVFQMAKKF